MKLMKAGIRFAMAMAAAVATAGATRAATDVPAKFAYSGRLERADGAHAYYEEDEIRKALKKIKKAK